MTNNRYGVPSQHTRPAGRSAFGGSHVAVTEKIPPKAEVVKPGSYPNGLPRAGTVPAQTQHQTGKGYLDPTAKAYRDSLRSEPITNNFAVSSKGSANGAYQYASDPRQPSQPATPEQRDVAASAPVRDITSFGAIKTETVGILPDGSGRYRSPTYSNAREKATTAGIDVASTRGSKGMADKA